MGRQATEVLRVVEDDSSPPVLGTPDQTSGATMLRAFVLFGALLGMLGCLGSAWAAPDEDAVRPLGIGLEEITYPYPVQFLDLVIEGQAVGMAYMDVVPTRAGNGKTAV